MSLSALIFVSFEMLDFFFFPGQCCSPFVWKILSLLTCSKLGMASHSCFGKIIKSDPSHARHYKSLCVFCFILLHATTCAMEWWSCSDTAQAWAWVSQRRIWGVSWLSGQSISLLTTAAAAVSKRKSMPIVMSYPWESVVITLCPGCQEQHSSSVLSASLQMWFLTRSSWRGRKMLLLKHVLTLAAIKTFLQCPAVALGGGVKNYSHQQVHLQILL